MLISDVIEGESSPSDEGDLLGKIKRFILSILEDLNKGRLPSIILNQYRVYCSDSSGNCCCRYGLIHGKEIISCERGHWSRLDIFFRVLLIIQQLLQEKKHMSKRDIYYTHPHIFSEQAVVDRAINDICILLQCGRHNLNVVSVGKGLVMGWLKFREAGRKIECIRDLSAAYRIPVCVEEINDVVSVAQYILVVEKETVLQRLADDKFCEANCCIVITGRGYPDVSTRRFLQLLVDSLKIPCYCLVDYDPHGFDILATYRFGSMQMAYDANKLRVRQLKWLGVFLSDAKNYSIPDRCLLPITQKDERKIKLMMSRCYLVREAPKWRLELELMLNSGKKFEIEALSVISFSLLTTSFLPSQIQKGAYI